MCVLCVIPQERALMELDPMQVFGGMWLISQVCNISLDLAPEPASVTILEPTLEPSAAQPPDH